MLLVRVYGGPGNANVSEIGHLVGRDNKGATNGRHKHRSVCAPSRQMDLSVATLGDLHVESPCAVDERAFTPQLERYTEGGLSTRARP